MQYCLLHCQKLSDYTQHIRMCFINSFVTYSLISTEIKQKDIDLKDYFVYIHFAEIDGQTED